MHMDGIWGSLKIGGKKPSRSEILQRIPLFSELSRKDLKTLEDVVHDRVYEAGETIFYETEPGAGMYVIRTGRVNIVLNQYAGHPIVLAELLPGDFFGEMALLGNMTRSATAVATEHSELIGFFHPDLIELIQLDPRIGARISLGLARTLANRLRMTSTQLREVWQARGAREASVG
jgi:CRP-like cAMP-binding protein